MKKLLLVLFVALVTQLHAQTYCDSLEISMNYTPNSFTEFSVNLASFGISGVTYDWTLTDASGNVQNATTALATFSLPSVFNSDTNYICLTSTFSTPAMTFVCVTCDTIVWNGTNWVLLSMMPPPCNLTGGSVYVDHSTIPVMMNATVNGASQYTYIWSNGFSANQTQYYQNWCVTITDITLGCDTTICENCIAIPNMCPCPMIYAPVCGCDGVQYGNSCMAECVGVGWTPAVSSGIPGGFLPCTPSCEVEIDGDAIICNWGNMQYLVASPATSSNPFVTYVWDAGFTGDSLAVSAPGTYCVTATDSTGCSDTECFTVSIQDIPIYSAPSSPTICSGDSIVLEIDTLGLSNITWAPNTLITPPVHRIVDFPISSQSYAVEAIDSLGCDMRGEIFVSVIYCSDFACMGGVAPGINTCVGPGNYAMGQPNVVAVYQTMASCIADSCSVMPPPPCIVEINNSAMDIEICDGDTATLEATSGFDTYLWTSLAAAGSLLGTAYFLEVTDPGFYIVVATDIVNNCADTAFIEVVIYPETPLNPMTAPNPPMVCLGDSLVIEVNSGFLNYWWNTGNSADQDEDRVVVYPTQDFVYVVEALDANGCESREEIEVFVDTCATGIMNILSAQVIIFPNPSNSVMTIQLPTGEVFDLVIYDVMGRLVLSENMVSHAYIIPDNSLANGTYILNLNHAKGMIARKLVIK